MRITLQAPGKIEVFQNVFRTRYFPETNCLELHNGNQVYNKVESRCLDQVYGILTEGEMWHEGMENPDKLRRPQHLEYNNVFQGRPSLIYMLQKSS